MKMSESTDTGDFHTIKHELEIIKRLDNTHVIKYMATCFTGHHIYIQMELCRCDLQELIEAKHRIFETEEELDANDGHVYVEPNDLEYFISVEMLREVAQGLQYLHDRQPPVFHRDLRPQNVFMVIDPDTNAPVLKLGDFCLDKLPALALRHHRERMSARYTAPEVNYICDEKFAFKQSADIYSLGMIVIDLFNFDFTGKRRYERLKSIWELAIALIEVKVAVRPTCNQLIDRVDDLDPMDTQLVLKQYTDYKEEFRDIENKHLDKYVSHKIALLSQSVC
ncbi:unnamed protein product [Medioppia subpectinata]|uniref:non-specific serine/threonine protein kinase n=1 Tax=Medioppia subpectinata TaxID=1979941 RepID=A0A7R9PU04_9ACAR|nr:unnamed protein product [Medioppia subpectinata]CAG2101080.1 unnamed protein product [Medioppia subpectinata]